VANFTGLTAAFTSATTSAGAGVSALDLTTASGAQAALATGVSREACAEYFSGLDYRLSYPHLAGLTEFFRRLVLAGRVPDGTLAFLPAA
jgi:chorismate dehydratase